MLIQQVRDGLVVEQPVGRSRGPEPDKLDDGLQVGSEVTGKNWLVMGDTVPQKPNPLQVAVHLPPDGRCIRVGAVREEAEDLRFPQTGVETSRKYLLPEHKLQFGDDLAGRGLVPSSAPKVTPWHVAPLGIGKAELKTVRPRPAGPIERLDTLSSCVPGDNLNDMKGEEEGSGDLGVPCVELGGLRGPCTGGLVVGRNPGQREGFTCLLYTSDAADE